MKLLATQLLLANYRSPVRPQRNESYSILCKVVYAKLVTLRKQSAKAIIQCFHFPTYLSCNTLQLDLVFMV